MKMSQIHHSTNAANGAAKSNVPITQQQYPEYVGGLIETVRDPLFITNPEGKITDMNQALANITGISREQLTGTDFFDYFTEPQKAREVYQEVFANGSAFK